MEGRNGSGSNSGGVVKSRSSSGCLVIKKKPDVVSGPVERKVYESKKAKKRARLSAGEALSSDEELLQYYRSAGGPGGPELRAMGFGRTGLMRSKLDVYDFDEYDDLSDVEMMGSRYFYGGGMETSGGTSMEFEGGSSKGDVVNKRRNPLGGGTRSERVSNGGKRRFEMENEMGISLGKDKFCGSKDAIRFQGKNGVLKVRVKQRFQTRGMSDGDNVRIRGQEISTRSIVIERHSLYSEKKLPKKPTTIGRLDKSRKNKRTLVLSQSSEEESEGHDSPPKIHSDSMEVSRSSKRGRRAGNLQSPETSQPIKVREGKVKRGSGTEKQLLREKIRSMLVGAGWTIDYRPRRGRDYSDAVYVNPNGTAYWSIIKAYDALQKQLEDEGERLDPDVDSSSFAPISEDTLSKLTRQTQKKIEKELKRKKREEGGAKRKNSHTKRNLKEDESDTDSGRHDERLSLYMKRSGRPLKVSSRDIFSNGSGSNCKMQEKGEFSSSLSSSRFIHGRKSNKIGRCTLLARNSGKGHDSESDGFVPYMGKRSLLSWLIDCGTVKLSEKLLYMNRRHTRVMLEGWATMDGIHCACCSKIVSVSKFEIHAGSQLRQPFQNIYLSSGASLLECQVATWNKQQESLRNGFNKVDVDGEDPNDDTCAMCGDGGNLICCDSCPSTFHQNCLDIQMLPPGDWHCPHCSCKFCGLASVGMAVINDTKEDALLSCSLCEGKYHSSCVEVGGGTPIVSGGTFHFCGINCRELFERLQNLLGFKHELEGGLCWSLIHRSDIDSDNSVQSFAQKVEWNSKLAVVLTIMDECFLRITDRRSGINMIHNVFFNCGSNFSRLNYSGFYTAVLERGDEIVSAASIRIHGTQFAEMPFIGTRHIYRRQGMCRRLLAAIEMALCSLKVEKLIIPAISDLMDTWTRVFGFSSLDESDKQEMKTMNMLVFPGTDMLQKQLVGQDVDSLEADCIASGVPDFKKASGIDSSPKACILGASLDKKKFDNISSTDVTSQHITPSAAGTCLNSVYQDISDEVKLPSHVPSTNVSSEVIVLGESRQTTTSPLQLAMNLKDSVEAKVTPEVIVDILVTKQVLDNHDQSQVAYADSKLMKQASDADTDIIGLGNDKGQTDGLLSTAGEKCPSLSERSDNILSMEKFGSAVNNKFSLEVDHHVSDVQDFTKTSNRIPDALLDSANVEERSIAIITSQYTESSSFINALQGAYDEVKPPSHSLSNNSCEVALVASGDGCEGTTSSSQLGMNLKEPMEDVKDHISLVKVEMDVTPNVLDNPDENLKGSADFKSMPEASKANTEIMGSCGPETDKGLKDGCLSAAGAEIQSVLETSHDVLVEENSVAAVDNRGSLEVDYHSDALNLTKTYDIDSSSELDIPDVSLGDGEVKGRSTANLTSHHTVVPVEGTSREGATLDSFDKVKSPSHSPMDISSEVTPVISGSLSRRTRTSPLHLNMNLKESIEDKKDHGSDDLAADTSVTANVIDNPAVSLEISTDCKLMQDVSNIDLGFMSIGGPGTGKGDSDGTSCETGVAAGDVDGRDIVHDQVDYAHAVASYVEEMQSMNISEVNDLAASVNPENYVDGSNLVCSEASGQSAMSGADKACGSLGNTSHGTVVADKSLLNSCDRVRSLVDLDSAVVPEDRSNFEVGDKYFLAQCSNDIGVSYDIQTVGHPACGLASINADNCSEMKSLNISAFHDSSDSRGAMIGDDACSQPCGQSAIPVGSGSSSSPPELNRDASEARRPQFDSCVGVAGQSIVEGNVKHAVVSTEDPVTQPCKQFSSVTSATYAEQSPQCSGENPPISTNCVLGDTPASPACEKDEKSSIYKDN